MCVCVCVCLFQYREKWHLHYLLFFFFFLFVVFVLFQPFPPPPSRPPSRSFNHTTLTPRSVWGGGGVRDVCGVGGGQFGRATSTLSFVRHGRLKSPLPHVASIMLHLN